MSNIDWSHRDEWTANRYSSVCRVMVSRHTKNAEGELDRTTAQRDEAAMRGDAYAAANDGANAEIAALRAKLAKAESLESAPRAESVEIEGEYDKALADLAKANERANELANEAARGSLRYRETVNAERDAARADADALAGLLRKARNECSMHRASFTLSPQDFTEIDAALAKHGGGK